MRATYLALHAALPACVLAQTFTDCNPLHSKLGPNALPPPRAPTLIVCQETCPPDPGLTEASHATDFTKGANGAWTVTYGTVGYGPGGAAFTMAKQGDAPTMQSNFYLFFGAITVLARPAPGVGMVSCAILESDDLDEMDWEWLGAAPGRVQTNYFGKGNTTTYDRGTTVSVPPPAAAVHNYTLDWTADATTWYIDNVPVRTLRRADALGGANYPQTPMRVKLGLWAGGDSPNPGTVAWAGGRPNYAAGPFTMTVERVLIRNYNPAASYTYRDTSGSSGSIGIEGRKRAAAARRDAAPAEKEVADPTDAPTDEAPSPSTTTEATTTAQATTLVTTTRAGTTVIPSISTANTTMTETTSSPPLPPPATAVTVTQTTSVPDLLDDCMFPFNCGPPS